MKLIATVVLFCTLALTGCTHTIRHAAPKFTSTATTGEITLVVSPEIPQKSVEQRIGINVDKWRFEIGNAFMAIVPSCLQTQFAQVNVMQSASDNSPKSNSIHIESLDIELDSGTTILGKHEVNLTTQVSYYRNDGSLAFSRTFVNKGSESGGTQLITWLPYLGTEGMNNAIEIAVTDSLVRLSEDLVKAIK